MDFRHEGDDPRLGKLTAALRSSAGKWGAGKPRYSAVAQTAIIKRHENSRAGKLQRQSFFSLMGAEAQWLDLQKRQMNDATAIYQGYLAPS